MNQARERVIHSLCDQHGIKLVDVAALPTDQRQELFALNGEENYLNRSWIIGSDKIVLGIYEDPELRLISFFHEFGHLLTSDVALSIEFNYNRLLSEIDAWNKGLNLARTLGVRFSDHAVAWGYTQALTYAKPQDSKKKKKKK